MQISLLLMEEIIKLFVIMFMGYAVVKAGLMKSSESKSVSVILVYLVIPCVIIKAFQVDYTPDVQKGLFPAIAAAVAVHILFLLITIPLKKIFQMDVVLGIADIFHHLCKFFTSFCIDIHLIVHRDWNGAGARYQLHHIAVHNIKIHIFPRKTAQRI